jgi:hypothetical protein
VITMSRTLTEIFEHAETIEDLNAASDEITARVQDIYDAYEPRPEDFHPNPGG